MVLEIRQQTGERHGAVTRVAKELGIGVESLRQWVNQAEVDSGRRPGTSSADAQRIAELERENRELCRANDPNRIWIYDAIHFGRARRVVFAIVDMVSRKWIDTLVSVEESATQVQVIFEHALEIEGLLDLLTDERLDLAVDDPARPILLAVSDNGPPMAATSTRAFMTLMAIAQHRGRPHTPTDQAWIETFFGHIKGEWPHLEDIDDPVVLEAELARVRIEYNSVRLHEAIGYVTPDDEHEGRGEQIREARRLGLARARQQRLEHHRRHTHQNPEETP
jgi:transposase InsO family protein